MKLPRSIALTTSWGERLYERSRSGSTLTTMLRMLPPNGGGDEMPARPANIGRTRKRARSWSCADRASFGLSKTR